jgi:hypothetical protein
LRPASRSSRRLDCTRGPRDDRRARPVAAGITRLRTRACPGQAHRRTHRYKRADAGSLGLSDWKRSLRAAKAIAYRHEDATHFGSLGADHELSRPRLDPAHCFARVQDHQVQDDLLHLNTIALHGKQPVRKATDEQCMSFTHVAC